MFIVIMQPTEKIRSTPFPSAQFHLAVRGGLVALGESLNAWSKARGYHQQNVGRALRGDWRGPRAHCICLEIREYLAKRGIYV